MNRSAAQGAGQIIGLIDGRQVVGLDVAKSVFQLHTVDMDSGEIVSVQLKRAKVLEHFIKVLHRQRELHMRMKVMQTNALRGLLYEFGAIFARGRGALFSEIEATLESLVNDIPQYVADSLREQAHRIKKIAEDIKAIEVRLAQRLRVDADMMRVSAIPGVGLMTATAAVATMGEATAFKSAREFCAWLGLVPSQRGRSDRDEPNLNGEQDFNSPPRR